MSTPSDKVDLSVILSDEDLQAQDLLKHYDFDEVMSIYQRLKPDSGRIFNVIGILYAEKKCDYYSAIKYYEKALQVQEKNDDDVSETLTELGFAYQNLREYDLALIYHLRVLSLRESIQTIDQKLVATNLFGIANAYWGQENLPEALKYAQQALILNESIKFGNDSYIAANLAILANIYHHSGDDIRALNLAKRALILFEGCASSDSPALVTVLNNIGAIQVSAGLLDDALLTFIRVLHISEKNLPKGHPTQKTIVNNIQRITEMQDYNIMNSFDRFWKFCTKSFLL